MDMQQVREVAEGLAEMVRAGQYKEAIERYYAPNIVSVEAVADAPPAEGIEAIWGKIAWWEANHETHGVTVSEPFVNGDQFAVLMTLDVTFKVNNARFTIEEIAVYTVKDGKIVHERFFASSTM